MREIKFRAKCKYVDGWIYANGFYFDGINHWFTIPNDEPNVDPAIAWAKHYKVESETIGQLTGMGEESGVDIFEGDVAEVTAHNLYVNQTITMAKHDTFAGKVVMENSMWMVRAKDATNIPLMDVSFFDMRLKIVGNFHDNPELLKTKEETR